MGLIEVTGSSIGPKTSISFYTTFESIEAVKRNWCINNLKLCNQLDKDLKWLNKNIDYLQRSKAYRYVFKLKLKNIRERLTVMLENLEYLKMYYDAFILNSTFFKDGKKLKINNKRDLDNFCKLTQEFLINIIGMLLKLDIQVDISSELRVIDSVIPDIKDGYFRHVPNFINEFSFK